MSEGYIYILINPSFMKLLKIGMTTKKPKNRARELSRTNVPFDFFLAYETKVSDCVGAEKDIHKKLENYRKNKNREFFKIPLHEAVLVVEEVAKNYKITNATVSKTKPKSPQTSINPFYTWKVQTTTNSQAYNVKPSENLRRATENTEEANRYYKTGLLKMKKGDYQSALSNMKFAVRLGYPEANKYLDKIDQICGFNCYYRKGIELFHNGEKENGIKFLEHASINGHKEAKTFLIEHKADFSNIPIENHCKETDEIPF